MKKINITYWITTSIFAAMMALSGSMYFVSPEVKEGFQLMGFNDAFRVELGVAKWIGGIVLLIPVVPRNVKDWVYAGFGITLLSAFILHVSVGDGPDKFIGPLVVFSLMALSYWTYTKRLTYKA